MIEFGVESFDQAVNDIQELIKLHYEEIALNKDVIPLDPDWDKYRALMTNNLACLITARDDGKLVGYSIFFVTSHPHYKSTIFANNDLIIKIINNSPSSDNEVVLEVYKYYYEYKNSYKN